VSTIRKLIDDVGDPPRFIETRRGEGYRFIANVTYVGEERAAGRATPPPPAAGRRTGAIAKDQAAATSPFSRWRLPVLAALLIATLILAWWTRRPADTGPESIERLAVLPIRTAFEAEPWLAPALTDHLMQAVSRIEGVTVVTPSFAADGGTTPDPTALAARLDVDALLLSTLEPTSNGVRLRTQLVHADSGSLLWSSVVQPPSGIPQYRQIEDLARAVATRLRPTLQLQASPQSVDEAAYRYYLQGRYYWSRRSTAGLGAALESYEAALAVEPDYADALVGAAESWLLLPLYGAHAPADTAPRASDLATRALDLEPGHARAHAVLGVIAMQYDWAWPQAEKLLREAVTLNPNDATAQQWLGEMYCYTLRFENCRRHLERAATLDPLSPLIRWIQGSPPLWFGDYANAVEGYTAALADEPDFGLGRYSLGLAYAGLEDWDNAIAAYEAALPVLGPAIVNGPLVFALARAGDLAAARRRLAELEALAAERYVPPTKLAIAYLGLGERERALEWLARAIVTRDDRLVYLAVDVHLRGLRADPGFREIAAAVGLRDVLEAG
jgi:serine/threonine-protein kinase